MNPFRLPIILSENNTLVLNIIVSIHKYMIDSNIKSIITFEQVLKNLNFSQFLDRISRPPCTSTNHKIGDLLDGLGFLKVLFMHLVSSHQNIF